MSARSIFGVYEAVIENASCNGFAPKPGVHGRERSASRDLACGYSLLGCDPSGKDSKTNRATSASVPTAQYSLNSAKLLLL
jgi:hypothetical protein